MYGTKAFGLLTIVAGGFGWVAFNPMWSLFVPTGLLIIAIANAAEFIVDRMQNGSPSEQLTGVLGHSEVVKRATDGLRKKSE